MYLHILSCLNRSIFLRKFYSKASFSTAESQKFSGVGTRRGHVGEWVGALLSEI